LQERRRKKTDKVAILVVSHNNPELTNSLCSDIIKNTKNVSYDLHVIETGSDIKLLSDHTTLWVGDGCRMTRGFNHLKRYADSVLSYTSEEQYDAYMLFVNDAKFIENQDMVSVLYEELKKHPDCGQIHPYQENIYQPHDRLGRLTEGLTRKESFSEIICPMISADAWEKCGENLLDDIFYYGWGLDYDIPYQMHTNGYRCYITDKVGVFHQPFTSYRESHITKEKLKQQEFIGLARENMHNGFIHKYGHGWMQTLMDAVPPDVSKEALYLWLYMNDGFRGTI